MKAPLARQDDPEAVPRKPRHARLQHRQHFVEQLWSRAVAAQRSPPQTLKTRNRPKQAETVALGFAPPLGKSLWPWRDAAYGVEIWAILDSGAPDFSPRPSTAPRRGRGPR